MAKRFRLPGNYSFVSCSDEAVENGRVQLEHYPIVDFILGLEKDDIQSDPARKTYYKTFSSPMQRLLTAYCQSGGNLLVSGSYIGSDMSNSQGNREFTETVLKYGYQSSLSDTRSGQISGLGRTIQIPRLLNEKSFMADNCSRLPCAGRFCFPGIRISTRATQCRNCL